MKRIHLFGLIILALLIVVPFFWVRWMYGDALQFDPVRFTNELFKFSLGIISIFVVFWLANLLWADRVRAVLTARVRKSALRFLCQVHDLADECKHGVDRTYPEDEGTESDANELRILECFKLMNNISEAFLANYSLNESSWDESYAKALDLIWNHIAPAIKILNALESIRGRAAEIKQQLTVILDSSEKGFRLLEHEVMSTEYKDYTNRRNQ